MKMINYIELLIIIPVLFIFQGCGGSSTSVQSELTKTAQIKLLSLGTSTLIYGIDVTVSLPPGVTVKLYENSIEISPGSLFTSGSAAADSMISGVYTSASSTLPGKVRAIIINAYGMPIGEFCTVIGTIAEGYSPQISEFSVIDYQAHDRNGNVLSGLTPSYIIEIN